MKKWYILLLAFLVSTVVYSFNKTIHPIDLRNCKSDFRNIYIGKTDVETVKNYLFSSNKNLTSEYCNITLRTFEIKESLGGGVHQTFLQTVNGIPVYRSQIKVNLDKSGYINSIFDNSFPIGEALSNNFPDNQHSEGYLKNIGVKSILSSIVEKTYFFDGFHLLPALRVEIKTKSYLYFEVILNENGNIIYEKNLNSSFKPTAIDSLVDAFVYMPDPLTCAKVMYGKPYYDNNDSDNQQLNDQRKQVKIKVKFNNADSSFRLQNSAVSVIDQSSPTVAPVFSTVNPNFNYLRSQSGFEDVNAFYHITYWNQYIHQLGFTTLVTDTLFVDTHALNNEDQSLFNAPNTILFGEGGVDDAEDADVIVHEYGHAIAYSASNSNSGQERQIIDEGGGDFLASSYSRSINPYRWEYVFSWDGHNEYWDGRMTSSTEHYPEDLKLSSLYASADIWSSTLMEISNDIGDSVAYVNFFKMLYGLAPGMTMTDAANVYIKADSLMFGGLHYTAICNRFYLRGIISNYKTLGLDPIANTEANWATVTYTSNFQDNSFVSINFNKPVTANIKLMDMSGRIVLQESTSNTMEFELNTSILPKGVYVLNLQNNERLVSFKLIK